MLRQQTVIEGGGSSKIFLDPRAYIEAELKILPSSTAHEEAQAWNFSKSQGPYEGGEIGIFPSPEVHIHMGVPNPLYRHISSYSFIFWTYFFILFSTYSFIFLHIVSYFHIFLHIFDIFLHIF